MIQSPRKEEDVEADREEDEVGEHPLSPNRSEPPTQKRTVNSSLPEIIKCCRKLRGRDMGYSDEEFFYFIATSIETLAEDKIDDLFRAKYSEPLKEIRKKAGLEEDQYWEPGDPTMPDEYRDLLEEFRKEKRAILSKSFRSFGEAEMGGLVEEDYGQYVERKEKGQQLFYSRHKFEAVRMEPSEMNPEFFETEEEPEKETGPSADRHED